MCCVGVRVRCTGPTSRNKAVALLLSSSQCHVSENQLCSLFSLRPVCAVFYCITSTIRWLCIVPGPLSHLIDSWTIDRSLNVTEWSKLNLLDNCNRSASFVIQPRFTTFVRNNTHKASPCWFSLTVNVQTYITCVSFGLEPLQTQLTL